MGGGKEVRLRAGERRGGFERLADTVLRARCTVVRGYVSVEETELMRFRPLRAKEPDEITVGQLRSVLGYRTTTSVSHVARTRTGVGKGNRLRESAHQSKRTIKL